MNERLLCVVIAVSLLAVPMACLCRQAAAAEESPTVATTVGEKVKLAHELLGQPGKQSEVIKLVRDVGITAFLAPVIDDEKALLDAVQEIMDASTSTEESMVLADIATFLRNDERPAVRDRALKEITRLALYTDKPFVSEQLFAMYQKAKDDADLRIRIAEAFLATGLPDPEGKEPRPYDAPDYEKTIKRLPELLKDPDWRVRCAVVRYLPKTLDSMDRSGIGALEKDRDARVRAALIDYYRETKVKTATVREFALRGLAGSQFDELNSAVTYCIAMKMDEAREPMYAWMKRNAGPLEQDDPATQKIGQLKQRVIRATIELAWKDATPDLLWLVDNEADWRASARAAYAVLKLAGQEKVQLGPTEEVFPMDMVEAEHAAMMMAFKAWRIRDYEGQGQAAEVLKLDEEAQIEFSDKVYEIAKQRLSDTDIANKRRGLKLVMDIGPADFARQISTVEGLRDIYSSVRIFPMRYGRETETNRMIARLLLGFVEAGELEAQKMALSVLLALAHHVDKDEANKILTDMMERGDLEIRELGKQVINVVSERGFSGNEERMKEKLRYKEDEAGEKPGKQ